MKKIIVLGIIALSLLSTKLSVKSFKIEEKSNVLNPLALYGEKIFQRENCISCHTLSIENTNKISLDGLGKKMSTEWLYQLFKNPKNLIVNCKMPSYNELFNQDLSKEILKDVLIEYNNYNIIDFEKYWNDAIQKSDSISSELIINKENYLKRKEVFALIEFLQNIPSTDKKKELDNLQLEKEKIENEKWDAFILKSDSLVSLYSKDKTYLLKGKEQYENYCIICHNQNGTGMIGPNLTDENSIYGIKTINLATVILFGTDNGMPNHKSIIKESQLLELLTYIKSLNK